MSKLDSVSLCMIVKNAEAILPRCLDSAKNIADEIIIVDTGSTDRTVSIAEGCGARVFPFDFQRVDFAAARNYAISKAIGDWILVLDADERLDLATAPLIRQLIALNENAGYYFQRRNYSANDKAKEPTVDHVVRLFRNREGIRYQGRVHETVDQAILATGGRLRRTSIFIDHAFSSDPEERQRKNHWYIEILKEEIEADPNNISRLEFLAAEYHQLERIDEAITITEQIVATWPRNAQAHLNLGVYHLLFRPNYAKARADFQEALKLKPRFAEAQSFLGLLEELEASAPVSKSV